MTPPIRKQVRQKRVSYDALHTPCLRSGRTWHCEQLRAQCNFECHQEQTEKPHLDRLGKRPIKPCRAASRPCKPKRTVRAIEDTSTISGLPYIGKPRNWKKIDQCDIAQTKPLQQAQNRFVESQACPLTTPPAPAKTRPTSATSRGANRRERGVFSVVTA